MNLSASSPHEGDVSRMTQSRELREPRDYSSSWHPITPPHQMRQKGHYGGGADARAKIKRYEQKKNSPHFKYV